MFARCSGEFMYAVKSWSALDVGPSPTFSPYVVQLGLPCDSSSDCRLGLCAKVPVAAMCDDQPAATVVVPLATVSARRPCWARASLTRVTRREVNADEVDSADADGAATMTVA